MKKTLLATLLSTFAVGALADINIGVTLSATGPAASLGIPEKNTIDLLPKTIAGQKVNYIVLDDASDTTTAVKNAKKLISENKVDLIIGSTTTPNSLAMIDVAAEGETPMIAMAAASPPSTATAPSTASVVSSSSLRLPRLPASSSRWTRSANGSSRHRRTMPRCRLPSSST